MGLRLALLALLVTGCSHPPINPVLVVTGSTVIDVRDGSWVSNSTIVIAADRIRAVGLARNIPIPAEARVIEARGKYVIPGLWDLHAHIMNERELDFAFPPVEPLLSTWSDEKASALFGKFVKNQTWQTPTLVNCAVRDPALSGDTSFWNDSNLAFMPKDWVDSWRPDRNQFLAGVPPSEVPRFIQRMEATHDAQLDLVRRMHEADGGFLAGTDVSNWNFTVPGVSLHDELALFVKAGLTPLEALQTATINPAKYLNMENISGLVATGKRADVLILDADLTQDIANTKRSFAALIGGRLIDRSELHRMLDAARQLATESPQR